MRKRLYLNAFVNQKYFFKLKNLILPIDDLTLPHPIIISAVYKQVTWKHINHIQLQLNIQLRFIFTTIHTKHVYHMLSKLFWKLS